MKTTGPNMSSGHRLPITGYFKDQKAEFHIMPYHMALTKTLNIAEGTLHSNSSPQNFRKYLILSTLNHVQLSLVSVSLSFLQLTIAMRKYCIRMLSISNYLIKKNWFIMQIHILRTCRANESRSYCSSSFDLLSSNASGTSTIFLMHQKVVNFPRKLTFSPPLVIEIYNLVIYCE